MLWSQFDEDIYQRMVKEYNSEGDKIVMFNGVKGPLSSLIEAVELVRSMAGYKDEEYEWDCRSNLIKRQGDFYHNLEVSFFICIFTKRKRNIWKTDPYIK